jgi:hypothetical protein
MLSRSLTATSVSFLTLFVLGQVQMYSASAASLQHRCNLRRSSRNISGQTKLRLEAEKKIDSRLLHVIRRYNGSSNPADVHETDIVVDAKCRVPIDVRAKVTPDVLSLIKKLGGEVTASYPAYNSIESLFPLEKLENLAASRQVLFIGPLSKAINN